MPAERILILGGTGEARALAETLMNSGFDVVTSLAGVTTGPRLPVGEVRRGGFGGAEGLAGYLRTSRISAVVDATHPFATQISRHAKLATEAASKFLCRLERPAWQAEPGDRWIDVGSIAEAVEALPAGAQALVTIGRKGIAAFFARPDISGVARMIESPLEVVPKSWLLIMARPPFSVRDETRLIEGHYITHVVVKNSGGEDTRAKLVAARERNIPVVMLRRPLKSVTETYDTAEAVHQALRRALSS
jgi:precorrin-6A/cobalt-precorrin-6A reductase